MTETPSVSKQFESVRRLFPHTNEITFLNCASYGPFCRPVQKVIEDHAKLRVDAESDVTHMFFSVQDELRSVFADLIGANRQSVGIGMNTSFGINIAAFGLPLDEGDEILLSDVEFPATVYTWRAAAETRKLKLMFVPSVDRCFSIENLEKSISNRTRVLSLSWVQFFNGYKNDLKRLVDICKRKQIYVIVDGIQGMGTEPIDVHKLGIDLFTSGCQKWMLSPQGGGFFYLSDNLREQLQHPFMSWLGVDWKCQFGDLFHYDKPYFDSARRFEMGYYSIFNIIGMLEASKLFTSLGLKNIQRHNCELIDNLVEYIQDNPYYRVTSSLEKKHRSSILTFTCKNIERLHEQLTRNNIMLVCREGSIRVSLHLFNNQKDVDKLTEQLDSFSASN